MQPGSGSYKMKLKIQDGRKVMDSVNRTLYIPLYGKAAVSKQGILLHDPKAEEIWAKARFR